jgi:lactobin A/cerein 7B family class IIb bacteriocin
MKNPCVSLEDEFEVIELDESQLKGVQGGIGTLGVAIAVFIGTSLGAIKAHRNAVNRLKPCKA